MTGLWQAAGLRIRPGREADEAAVRRFVPSLTGWATTVSAHGAVVAVRQDDVVGVLVRWPHPDHVLVELLAVTPHERRAGVGSLLLVVAEREAVERGVNAVRAQGSGEHVPLLLRHGFTPAPDGGLQKRLEA